MKYLIVRCTDLYDQNECDADRRPLVLVDDWEKWVSAHPKEHYEIYCNRNARKRNYYTFIRKSSFRIPFHF